MKPLAAVALAASLLTLCACDAPAPATGVEGGNPASLTEPAPSDEAPATDAELATIRIAVSGMG